MISSRSQTTVFEENILERESSDAPSFAEKNAQLLDPEKYDLVKYPFKKCTEIGIETLFAVKDSLSPVDIVQGELQDCWIVSSVCSIAVQQLDLLKKIILAGELPDSGRYRLRLCVAGRWKLVE